MSRYSKRFIIDNEYLVTGYGVFKKRIFRFVNFDFNLGYVIGAYISVGNVNISKYKNSYRGLIFWYLDESVYSNVDKLSEALRLAFNLNLISREQKNSKTKQVVCYSKPMAYFLLSFGSKSGRKKIPEEFIKLSNIPYVKGLVAGIEDFNGHKPDSRNILNKRVLNINVIEFYNMIKTIDSKYN